ncbi:substrate-binding domain-containing protein [Paenibacillus zanthoxyli]|uniref:substrate-binding domain-containing protein n=1 Tax=Paenibacillus zanthoxyli TaxID=369399 RepID=UPI00046E5868|nr:substrate-binding domain-containing protein [Paenibacillus zanthoxyli]
MSQDTFYTIDEVAKLLRVSKLKVYDMVKKRELPFFRVGRQIRIDSTDISRFKVKKLLMGVPVLVIRLSRQYRGIYVQRGNPLRIQNSNDLAREDICYYARNPGPGSISASTDLEAALQVANGAADASIGIESCAFKANVDFIPLTEELHDLVVLRTPQNLKLIGEVADIIRSEPFRKELSVIGGYDLTESGRVVYEAI